MSNFKNTPHMTTKPDKNFSSKFSFSNFNTPQEKRRIRIHKLLKVMLINTMQRKKHQRHKETDDSIPIQQKQKNKKRKNGKCTKSKIHLPEKVGSILHNVFGHKKSKDTCSSSSSKEEKAIFRSHSLKRILDIKDDKEEEEEKQEEYDNGKMLRGKSLTFSLSLSGLFSKRVVFRFRKYKSNNRSNSDQIGSQILMGNQEYGRKFVRNQSGYRKIRSEMSNKKVLEESEERREEEEEEVKGEGELWKKKILKGAKCRPVQLSGDLKIDINGSL